MSELLATEAQVRELAAFPDAGRGGNPAGVWIGEALPAPAEMQAIAARLGHSETAFIAPAAGLERTIRYYSPQAEVPFCGHATIASGVALGEREGAGDYRLQTRAGLVELKVSHGASGFEAALRSVPTRQEAPAAELLEQALELLGWKASELDPAIPPMRAYAGAWHLVLAVRERARLARLDYAFEPMRALMLKHDLTTLQLIWRSSSDLFHSRNPFPVGGVVEDPATGAPVAALGGYLRDAGLLKAPAKFTILQGEDMAQPSRIEVEVPEHGGIVVRGTARALAS
jgi:PhzF family phenazine biosynthesis protein